MKRLLSIFILSTLLLATSLFCKTACIIIHGTWASQAHWYKPEGDFFEAIKPLALIFYDEIIPFSWSGKNKFADRYEAGKKLAHVIENYDSVIIIAHSHGANVGIIASQILASHQNFYKIKKFYALGVPVHLDLYPHMEVIQYFYNMFSFSDKVQRVLGFFDRIFAYHPRIANLAILLDDKAPGHSGLHHKSIGKWLLFIHEYVYKYNKGGFGVFTFYKPGIIKFYSDGHDPEYAFDYHRIQLLEKEITLLHAFQKIKDFHISRFLKRKNIHET